MDWQRMSQKFAATPIAVCEILSSEPIYGPSPHARNPTTKPTGFYGMQTPPVSETSRPVQPHDKGPILQHPFYIISELEVSHVLPITRPNLYQSPLLLTLTTMFETRKCEARLIPWISVGLTKWTRISYMVCDNLALEIHPSTC